MRRDEDDEGAAVMKAEEMAVVAGALDAPEAEAGDALVAVAVAGVLAGLTFPTLEQKPLSGAMAE